MNSTFHVTCFNSIIKHGVPSPYIFLRVIITNTKLLLSLWRWFIFLDLLLNSLPPMIAVEVKHAFPILHFDGIISFAVLIVCFNVKQHFFVTILQYFTTQMFWLELPSLTSIFLWICLQGKPQRTPNIDVVRLNTYLTLDHKVEDTETHHIHNQA